MNVRCYCGIFPCLFPPVSPSFSQNISPVSLLLKFPLFSRPFLVSIFPAREIGGESHPFSTLNLIRALIVISVKFLFTISTPSQSEKS